MLHIQVTAGIVLLTCITVARKYVLHAQQSTLDFYNPNYNGAAHSLDPLLVSATNYKRSDDTYVKKSDGGLQHNSQYHSDKGSKGKKGYKKHHHHDVSDDVKHGEKYREDHYEKDGGKKASHHDEAEHYSKHQKGGKSHKAAKFGEKKGHKKGHKTKGYHNKFYRDEYHREHKFYDDFHKSGHHSKEGNHHKYHENKSGGRKKGSSHKSGNQEDLHGKSGHHDKGAHVEEHKGFKGKKGHKSHSNHSKKYGNKNSSSGGKQYAVVEGNHEK